MSPI